MVYLSRGILVGYGHLSVHLDVFGRMAWYYLLLLVLGKILATSLTLTTGGSGGLFRPRSTSARPRAALSASGCESSSPTLPIHPGAYALVGMGALVAGATNAPITGILIVFEMTNDYAIVLPLMLTTVICHQVSRRLAPDSLYSGWLRRRGEQIEAGAGHAAHRSLRAGRLRARAALVSGGRAAGDTAAPPPAGGADGVPRREPRRRPARRRHDGRPRPAGPGELDVEAALVAADVAEPTETVTMSDTLLEATRRMGVRGVSALPVIEGRGRRLIGMIGREHIVAAYERALTGGR